LKCAILSDIHGNLEAFKAVLDYLTKEDIGKMAFLGDIVGYGASPNECIDLLKGRADVAVAGNHDFGTVELTDTFSFNSVARTAIEWTRTRLSDTSSIFLSRLPLTSVLDGITFVHSTPYRPKDWDYLFLWSDVIRNFDFYKTQICFIGHSHTPAIFIKDNEGRIYSSKSLAIRLEERSRYIINVGSVGQPRDGIPDAAFGVLDTKEMIFTIKRVSYDIETAQKKIIKAGLPEQLASRIAVGR